MSTVEVRRLSPDDWALCRDIRLAALRDTPDAFASSYDKEAAYSEAHWRARTMRGAVLVAWRGGRPVGTAAGWAPPDGDAELFGMWVEAGTRGSGVGDALVDGVVEWAHAEGRDRLALWVTRGNVAANRLYTRHGFVRIAGVPVPPSHPCRDEDYMRLDLR
jgi:GNAT superfamily N-acetyltransferase